MRPRRHTTPSTFLGAQFDRGLAWVHFPEGFGGLGLSPEAAEARSTSGCSPPARPNAVRPQPDRPRHVRARRSWRRAASEQKQRYLRPLFTGEEIWCQLFSEPGAGSDVAGLSTRGVRDGDEWIVNGQKVWTTLAHLSRFGHARRAHRPRGRSKHTGLTAFVVDMHAPGVEVRPLRQMTGEAEFNEVYFTDVRIPDAERLGDVGDGWRVSLTTLMNERVSIGGTIPAKGSGTIAGADRRRGRRCPTTARTRRRSTR